MKVLFDLRDHPDRGIVRVANERLAAERPDYFARFGPIGSDRWWQHFDAGRISRTEHVGEITHVGATSDEFGETCDIIRVTTDRGDIEYDREGFWLDPALAVGKWLHIERAKAIVHTPTGPVIIDIDVRVWLDDAS